MKLFPTNRSLFERCIDFKYGADESILLRYMNAFKFETIDHDNLQYKEWLKKASIQEGARIFFLLNYHEVDVYILDETSLMHTKTLKSIDGCVSTAKCKLKGYNQIVFESGANTGTALTEYGQKAGLETYFFIPERNLSLLNSEIFSSKKAHLLSVQDPRLLKQAVRAFADLNRVKHVPEVEWRYEAAMFRGLFILEHMMANQLFDWLTQAISSAFGPIGIYNVLASIIHYNVLKRERVWSKVLLPLTKT